MKKAETATLKERVFFSIEKIKPYLIADGGDIELVEVLDDSVVNVRVWGACADCKFLPQTMKAVSEAIKKDAPEIREVNTVK